MSFYFAKSGLFDRLLTSIQYIIPQQGLSRLVFKITRLTMGPLTYWLIKGFIKFYQVDMSSAQFVEVRHYATFNQFFTRALKPTARPLSNQAEIISPVDGEISQIGQIEQGQLLQAKGHYFQLEDLLAKQADMVTCFERGLFCICYLSPRDYHRIHMPITGQLTDMIYVPGRLFSVNQRTSRVVPNLFARNERVICLFTTAVGPMALILVGALLVGSIETVWAGAITPNQLSQVQRWHYQATSAPVLSQGAELGRFNMGSTVILLFDANQVSWLSEITVPHKQFMGQSLARSLR
jgi:phosphatidylserine decarboxylase